MSTEKQQASGLSIHQTEKEPQSSIHAHVPKITTCANPVDDKGLSLRNFFYNLVIAFAYIVSHIFFREVEVAGLHNVPKDGPAILVCAPHANQFIDAAIIYVPIKQRLGRNVSGIIAEASYKRRFIGLLSRWSDSIPVPRAQDKLKPAEGKIFAKKSNIQDNGGFIKVINGQGTKFTKFEESGIIGLPNRLGSFKVKEIVNDEELILVKPVTSSAAIKLLSGDEPTEFKYCDKVDTNSTFQNVFNHLYRKGLIAIFPEGGSHDRTELLPLKPGVAIMALGSIAAVTHSMDPNAKLSVIPTGLYYFHRNKFRSRAIVEFGEPIVLDKTHGDKYIKDPKATVDAMLKDIRQALDSVTINAPDRETLRTIKAIRRLYKANSTRPMNLATINEVSRRLLIGWSHFRDDEKIQHLFKSVADYNDRIFKMGLKDHQIKSQNINQNRINALKVLLNRLAKLVVFGSLSLPGVILFSPVFILVKYYSKKKQEDALRNSTVKIKAKDVVATWKVLIATLVAPVLYVVYSVIGVKLIRKHNLLMGVQNAFILFILCYLVLVFTTYSAYRIGEAGVDIVKSLPPLFIQLYSRNSLVQIKQYREKLSNEVTDACNELGPSLFSDFGKFYEVGNVEEEVLKKEPDTLEAPKRAKSSSFSSLSNIAFFSHDGEDTDVGASDSELQEDLESSYEKIDSSSVPTGTEIYSTQAERKTD